ncbi:RNA 2',3'-cyclic phosphodiesterase [Candidatus Woesearchaeota archaeon]|nr:RNA 2',3'-cyclic phosphodiesterase [Candidatus Woesearchaeota archaeon]
MRLFIAIDICKELKQEIANIQEKIKDLGRIKTVLEKNLHLTLKFLGEVDAPEKIIELLEKIDFKEFSITSSNIGFFPSDNFINVVWIGFKEANGLIELQKKICETLSKDFKKEKDYIPHLTIARIKYLSPEEKAEILKLKQQDMKEITFKTPSFKLMKSTLTDKGPVYEVLKEFKAKGL